MAGIEESPQRAQANVHLARARHHQERRKIERALEEAHLAIQADPTFEEARLLAAALHEQLGETKKAVHQYEQVLFARGGRDEEILQHLQRLDPVVAEKHRRLASIGADPFVAKGVSTDEFLEFDETEAEPAPESRGEPALRVGRADDDAFLEMEEAEDTAVQVAGVKHVTADVFADEEVEVTGPRPLSPEEYEYDDERKYRLNAMGLDVIKSALREHRRLWATGTYLEDLMAKSPPLAVSGHIAAAQAFEEAARRLNTPTTVAHSSADPGLAPLICGPMCAYVLVPKGAIDALTPNELRFYAGRTLAQVACGHVPLLDIAAALLPTTGRKSKLQETRERIAAEFFNDLLSESPETLDRARKALHIWRLRAALTADRAGLACCLNVQDALSAIAKLTASQASEAARLSPETFKQKFEGQDLRRIAHLAPDRDTDTSEPYAFYRMLMVSWWSKQPSYARLAES